MAEQRYVYTAYVSETGESKLGSMESIINEYATEGWRLSSTLESKGTTVGLVFERKV